MFGVSILANDLHIHIPSSLGGDDVESKNSAVFLDDGLARGMREQRRLYE